MKKYKVCLLMFMCICLITEKAYALSVQARYGIGVLPFEQIDGFSSNSIGLDLFVYEGGNLDVLLGVEQFSESGQYSGRDTKLKYSVNVTAFDLGFRFKMTTRGRFKPYLIAGLAYLQNANYDVKSGNPDYTVTSISQDNKIGIMLGGGTDIGIGDKLALVVQLGGTYNPTVRAQGRFSNGSTTTDGIGSSTLGGTLGLKYSF